MNGHQHSRSTNYWISIFLILLGALFLLQNLGLFYIGGLWDFWPLILIAIGFAKLFDSGFKNLFGPSAGGGRFYRPAGQYELYLLG